MSDEQESVGDTGQGSTTDEDRVEGYTSERITATDQGWLGGGVYHSSPTDFSDLRTMLALLVWSGG